MDPVNKTPDAKIAAENPGSRLISEKDYDKPGFIDMVFEAAKTGDAGTLERAVNTGADINLTDSAGMTVLHHAIAHGAKACIRMLVASGKCNYLIRDNFGRLPSDVAFSWGTDIRIARMMAKLQRRQATRLGVNPFSKPEDWY
jgi:hypothetical protein